MTEPLVPPGPHGGDGPRLAARLGRSTGEILDLSQSLNPVAPDPAPVIARHLESVRSYPDPTLATGILASHLDVDVERLVLTNGGAEAIALVAQHLGRGWVDEPDFSLYGRHLPVLDRAGPRFRSNPHNPTGRLAPADEQADVWDEAFYPLATGAWTRGDRGSWVVGSLTKLFACPGLRIGYVITPDDKAADAIRARQSQWSVSSLACASLPDLLMTTDLQRWRDQMVVLRNDLVDALKLYGYEAITHEAPWVLVEDAKLRDRLAHHGIAVRDCATFGMSGVVRIAVPDRRGLDRVVDALDRRRPPDSFI